MNKIIKQIIKDTLKDKYGKWSRTSLTMASAWWSALFITFIDFFLHGFNSFTFGWIVSIAIGSKIGDSLSKKIHNPFKNSKESTETTEESTEESKN